jgi:hypothetical protein
MNRPPSLRHLARAYGVAAPSLIGLRDRLAIAPEVLSSPDKLFAELIEHGTAGKLRDRLADPAARREITAQISNAKS